MALLGDASETAIANGDAICLSTTATPSAITLEDDLTASDVPFTVDRR
jgi:hypothetical protein